MPRREDIKKIMIIGSGPIIIDQACEFDDSYIRKEAIKHKIPYITTLAAAVATAGGIKAFSEGQEEVCSLQHYHSNLS